MTYAPPAIWGSGIEWGTFRWGDIRTSGKPTVYASLDGELSTVVRSASWSLGRSDWFDVLSPSNASIALQGDVTVTPNQKIILTTDSGTLWTGYTDDASVTTGVDGIAITTITATDVIGRLGITIRPPGKVYSGPTLVARWYPIGFYGDLADVIVQYLTDYAPDLSIDVNEGVSTGTLPALIDWYFDAPGEAPRKTLLELLNQAEKSSNAVVALTPSGALTVMMRYPVGSASVTALEGAQATWTRTTGRSSVINHWVLERPAYDDVTVLDAEDAGSIALYGERTMEITDYLSSTAAHFTIGFRTALTMPRDIIPSAVFPIGDAGDAALLMAPLSWVTLDGGTWQVMSVAHDVTPEGWTVTMSMDASQNGLNDVAEP